MTAFSVADLILVASAPAAGVVIGAAAAVWPNWRTMRLRSDAWSMLTMVAATAIAVAAVGCAETDHAAFLASVGWLLLFAALVDLRVMQLPDIATLGAALAALIYATSLGWPQLRASAAGWALGFSSLWLIARLYRARCGRDGMGLGDAKLFAASGALCGPLALPWILAAAAASALAVHWATARAGRSHEVIPFGPALALATYGALLTAT